MGDMPFEFSMDAQNERTQRERNTQVRGMLLDLKQERMQLNDLSQACRNRHEKMVQRIKKEVENWFQFVDLLEIDTNTEYYKNIMHRYIAVGVNERRRFSLENDAHKETIDAFLLRVTPLFEEYTWNKVEYVPGSSSGNRQTFASDPTDDMGFKTDEQNNYGVASYGTSTTPAGGNGVET